MRYPQVLVYETDGLLAELLRRSHPSRWGSLREPRRPEACLRLLRRGGPSVLVLKLGRDLERELKLLEQVSRLHPDTAVVVVGDLDQSQLAGLAWDLGAAYVLFPPVPRTLLPDLVAGLLGAPLREPSSAASRAPEAEGPAPTVDRDDA